MLGGAAALGDELCHPIALRGQATEDLVNVQLRTARVRVQRISFVQNEDAKGITHSTHSARPDDSCSPLRGSTRAFMNDPG